jgi:hypothetical protein
MSSGESSIRNEMSAVEKSRVSSMAAQKARANAKRGKTIAFNNFVEFDRLRA